MAKWGEGDPRWQVEHRDDGKNVNGWHWEEKNKLPWSKQRFEELLTGMDAGLNAETQGTLVIERVKDVTGDAAITTRKGNKKFAVFDLKVVLAWEGTPAGSETMVKGEICIEEIHSTGDEDDYVYSASVEGTGADKDAMRRHAEGMKAKIFGAIAQFVKDISAQE